MSWAQGMVASAAYIVGKAGHRINAKTAAVTFGSQIEAVLKPGEVPTEVRERSANGGVEEFDIAMAALDGALGLTTTPDSAKVLVIISDNELVNTFEPEKRAIWMKRMAKAGVAIVWVDQVKRTIANTEGVAIRWRASLGCRETNDLGQRNHHGARQGIHQQEREGTNELPNRSRSQGGEAEDGAGNQDQRNDSGNHNRSPVCLEARVSRWILLLIHNGEK